MATKTSPNSKGRKNVDRRREKSKVAARDRRQREGDVFDELQELVPTCPEPAINHVDRIAVLRLALARCKLRKALEDNKLLMMDSNGHPELNDLDACDADAEKNFSEVLNDMYPPADCMDGFILLVASCGTIVFITRSVSLHLGLTQADLMGQNLEDFVFDDDWLQMRKAMDQCIKNNEGPMQLLVRMKSVITARGRCLNFKSATYKAVSCSFVYVQEVKGRRSTGVWVMHAVPVSHPASVDGSNCGLTSRHTPDMKITYLHEKYVFLLEFSVRIFLLVPRHMSGTKITY
jgi:hypothetical protein